MPVSTLERDEHPGIAATEEHDQVARLRAGDEAAFRALVERHHGTMIAVASGYVRTRAAAEEVAQEAWLAVVNGLDRFEGRSTLGTWIVRIVMNKAMTWGGRESRSVPFSSLVSEDEGGPAVEPERFRPAGESFAGNWQSFPTDWGSLPEEKLLGRETLEVVKDEIGALPEAQRTVITMRDVAGCSAEEVCEALEISGANQRVLLHRARSRVREGIERHLDA